MATTGTREIRRSSTVRGMSVVNRQGESLGEVEELMIDLSTGRVVYAVLSFGGFLGLGEKLFAVPWGALVRDGDESPLMLDADRERLQDAPGFDTRNWPDFNSLEWGETVHAHYGAQPYWR